MGDDHGNIVFRNEVPALSLSLPLAKVGTKEGILVFASPTQDLETAFRASRRAEAFLAIEKKGKAAFMKVRSLWNRKTTTGTRNVFLPRLSWPERKDWLR